MFIATIGSVVQLYSIIKGNFLSYAGGTFMDIVSSYWAIDMYNHSIDEKYKKYTNKKYKINFSITSRYKNKTQKYEPPSYDVDGFDISVNYRI